MKSLSKQIIGENNWTRFIKETFIAEDNRMDEYLIVERRPALMVIPVIHENDIVYTYLVKQFRYPIGKEVWQFAMGTLDEGFDPMEHARKELLEETGLKAGVLRLMGEYFIDPGLSRQKCMIYVAESITEGGVQHLEETEKGMEAKRFSLNELEGLVMDGKLVDGWVFPGIYYLKKYLKA